jgi:hypothetical protein
VDHFDLYAHLRASKPDPVRRWAELEGKSLTMCEDLQRRHEPQPRKRLQFVALIAWSGKLIATILHAWFRDSR